MKTRESVSPRLIFACLLAVATADAMPVMPESIPVKRLVTSLSQRIQKNPDDVQAVYTLGRVHYFAFAVSTDTVYMHNDNPGRGPGLATGGGVRKTQVTAAERIAHLRNAVTLLNRAVLMKKADGNGREELALACAFDQGAPFASKAGSLAGVAPTEKAWIETAIQNYGVAFDKAAARDSAVTEQPMFGLTALVSYEAINSYKRLLGTRRPARAEKSRLDRMARLAKHMNELRPSTVITPLIFALDRKADLADLLSTRVVRFNLNGSNLPQRYTWVRSDTAILVWDPESSGRITSGRQLFGSVTWWMFWDDAYQALPILDDDRNGWLEGREIEGLALWFDRDEDGVSDSGEVIPVAATPIAAIATQATGRVGNATMNATGLRLKDGRLLPTYDWVATPMVRQEGR